MDGYIIGFLAISGLSIMIGIMAIIFLSFDAKAETQDTRIRYTQIRRVNTNMIETVNISGEKEVWQRSA